MVAAGEVDVSEAAQLEEINAALGRPAEIKGDPVRVMGRPIE